MHDREIGFDEVILKLKAAARANRTVEAAQVHLINLTEIIARAGRHWPHVRDRIRAGSMDFLKGCVDEDDIIIPCGDGFLIIYAQGERAVLDRRSAELQELLTAFYTGEEGLERLQARVNPKTIAHEALPAVLTTPASTAPFVETSRECGAHQIAFLPVWSAQADMVACHFCMPSYCDQGVMRFGYDAEYGRTGRHDGSAYGELDLCVLDAALGGLARMDRENARGIVGASVHISTLRRQETRMAYLNRLSAAPPALLSRFMLKISEIEAAAPPWTLSEWTGYLRQHVRHVALELHHAERALDRLSEANPWAVGFQLPPHRCDASEQAVRQMREGVAHWARAAQRQNLRLFVDGVRSGPLLAGAKDAGVDFLSGEMFWPARHDPQGAYAAFAPSAPEAAARVL